MGCGRYGRRLTLALALALSCLGAAQARRMVNTCPELTSSRAALNVQTPTLKYTVTTFDPSWFDTENPEKGPVLFLLTIGPGMNLDSLDGKLRLRMIVEVDTSRGRGAPLVVAMDRVSIPLSKTEFGRPLRSNEVFAFTWEAGGESFSESPFFELLIGNRRAPEMDIHFRFALTCENDVGLAGITTTIRVDSLGGDIGKLRYVRTIQALYPGTPATNRTPVSIYTINPIFKVASELFNTSEFNYPGSESRVEIFLYEVEIGQTPDDAMQGFEFAKIPMKDESPIAYPPDQPRLEPGQTYVWRARANLRGPTTEYMWSNALYFKIDERLEGAGSAEAISNISELTALEQQIKFGDDYAKRLMAALKIILGDNFEIFDLSRGGKVPAKGQIRLNGHPYTLEELERLAREFSQSRHSITRLRFQ